MNIHRDSIPVSRKPIHSMNNCEGWYLILGETPEQGCCWYPTPLPSSLPDWADRYLRDYIWRIPSTVVLGGLLYSTVLCVGLPLKTIQELQLVQSAGCWQAKHLVGNLVSLASVITSLYTADCKSLITTTCNVNPYGISLLNSLHCESSPSGWPHLQLANKQSIKWSVRLFKDCYVFLAALGFLRSFSRTQLHQCLLGHHSRKAKQCAAFWPNKAYETGTGLVYEAYGTLRRL